MSRRRQRRLERVKPQKGKVSKGYPKPEEAREGHSTIKYIEGKGLNEFTYYNNKWYSKKLDEAKPQDYTLSQTITANEIVLEDNGTILIGQSSNITGFKADQIENTPQAGVLRRNYRGELATLNLSEPPEKVGDIGFDRTETNSTFKFVQSDENTLSYDGTSLKSTRDVNDGNPVFQIGSSDTECLKIQGIFKGGEKEMATVSFDTFTESGDANAGKYFFSVDNDRRLEINDEDITIMGFGSATADTEALIIENEANAGSMTDTRTSIAFYQKYYDGSSPALVDSAKITVGTTGNWTSTASTQDAYMSFSSVLNGTMNTTIKTYGNGQTSFCEAGNEYVKILPHSTDSELDITGNFVLDASGDINLNADGGQVTIKDGTASHFLFDCDSTALTIYDDSDSGDLFQISVTTHGATTMSTVDDDASAADLSFRPDGDIYLRPSNGAAFTNSVIVDSDKTQTTGNNNPAFLIDNDYTGIVASLQIVTNAALKIESNQESPTMVGTVHHYGIHSTVTSGTTGTQKAYGFYNTVTGGDEITGIYSKVDDGNPDFKLVSSADTGDYCSIDTNANGVTTIATVDDGGDAASLIIDADGPIVLDSHDGEFIAKQAGAEFSVANSSYAGMILGYAMIGEDAAHATYTTTTSFAVPDSAMTVRFEAPPSGAVEVEVQVYVDAASGRYIYFGLSDNATYNALGNSYEHLVHRPDETDETVVTWKVVVTGLTAGNTYNYWFGAKGSGGTNYLKWGGTASLRYTDFIMKVTALPAATTNYAVYD